MRAYNFAHCTSKSAKTNEFLLVKLIAYKLTVLNYLNMEYKIFEQKKNNYGFAIGVREI